MFSIHHPCEKCASFGKCSDKTCSRQAWVEKAKASAAASSNPAFLKALETAERVAEAKARGA
jgi:hypothetical protein